MPALIDEKLLKLVEKEWKHFFKDYIPLSQKQLQDIKRCSDVIKKDQNTIN